MSRYFKAKITDNIQINKDYNLLNFVSPSSTIDIIEGIETYMKQNQISDIKELIGDLKT